MKIIADTSKDSYNNTYLVEADEREIKMILGDYYAEDKIHIGKEIKVSSIYDKYKAMTSNKKKLKTIRDAVKGINDSVSKIKPLVGPDTEEK